MRAIVFDFDGVIANSEPLHFRAFRDVAAASGVALGEAEYYERYLGYDDVGAFRAIGADHGAGWDLDQIAALCDRKAERLEALERDASTLFPGAADAIRRAAAAVPIAIASGALRAEIVRVLERAGLLALFTAIVAAEDTPASKPAPDPYRRAVALIAAATAADVPPQACVAIEDSHWGLESARAAGLRTVAVAQSYPAGSLGSADLIIDAIASLDVEQLRRLTL